MSKYILSIDQGTTSSRVCLFNKKGLLVDQAQFEFRQIYPKSGWVEHSAEEIWDSVLKCLKEIFTRHSVYDIKSIGITNQRETTVVWDSKTSKPLYNAIVWQCKRTEAICQKLKKKYQNKVQRITGLVIDPYFSATKIRWIMDQVPESKTLLMEGRLRAGTIDSFLMWKLTDGKTHATDVTNASRTLLMNLKSRQWDTECLKIFKIPLKILPEIKKSNDYFGSSNFRSLGLTPDPAEIPIHGVAGDQQAALFGQSCFDMGSSKCTFGTGSFILYNLGHEIKHSKSGLLTTVAWELNGESPTYAFEGGAFICGAAVTWLRDNLNLIEKSAQIETLAREVESTDGVIFVSCLSGLGAPFWKETATGRIVGLTRKTNKYHLARATLESMALQNLDIIKSMEKDSGRKLKELRVDGGAAKNNLLMQMQSDFLNRKVLRSDVLETTALGAAFLAGLGSGFWDSKKELKSLSQPPQEFIPGQNQKNVKAKINQWNKAIQNLLLDL